MDYSINDSIRGVCSSTGLMIIVLFPMMFLSSGSALIDSSHPKQEKFEYFDPPKLHWKTRLRGLTVGPLNAIEKQWHMEDDKDDILFMTTKEGILVVLSASDGSIVAQITPPPSNLTGIQTSISCQSGIVFGTIPTTGSSFLAYTIQDKVLISRIVSNSTHTTLIEENEIHSRIIAISIPGYEILWSSSSLPGESLGSPVLLSTSMSTTTTTTTSARNNNNNNNNNNYDKSYLALTHNIPITLTDNTTSTLGIFTLLDVENGEVIWYEPESNHDDDDDDANDGTYKNNITRGYSPLAIATNPIEGNYVGGEENRNDILVWGTYDAYGTSTSGNTFAFQFPITSSRIDFNNLSTKTLKFVRWTTRTKPILMNNNNNNDNNNNNQGLAMYVGASKDQIRGWNGHSNSFDLSADWEIDLSTYSTNPSSFIPAAPALSKDGQRLFVSTSTFSIHGIDSFTGSILWDLEGTSLFLSEPMVSPDDERVYFIQSQDGNIYSIDQQSGNVMWSVGCGAFDDTCTNSVVEGNFALSSMGEHLYYADVSGSVVALTLGKIVEISQDDDDDDDGNFPSLPHADSKFDDLTKVADDLDARPYSSRAQNAQIALLVLAILVLVLLCIFVCLLQRKKMKSRRQFPQDINRSSPSRREIVRSSFGGMVYKDYGGGGYKEEHFHTPFSGSRRVTPLKEDYSLGAVVLL